jgi:hypothetical protein
MSITAGAPSFRAWSKGVSCPLAKSLLSSDAVGRNLPRGPFVPPHVFTAKNLVCAFDPFTLVCWSGHPPSKRLSIGAYHRLAARSSRAVIAATVGVAVSAPSVRSATVKVIRALAQGKPTSTSASAWKGGCSVNDDSILPGVRTWQCTLVDTKSPSGCIDTVFLYRSGRPERASAALWRWEPIEGTTPPMCR